MVRRRPPNAAGKLNIGTITINPFNFNVFVRHELTAR